MVDKDVTQYLFSVEACVLLTICVLVRAWTIMLQNKMYLRVSTNVPV